MTAVQIVFSVAYVALLISYFFSETSGNFKRRAVNKIVMATMFLGYVAVEFVRLKYNFMSIELIMLLAFIFAWLGDVLLLWSFMKGGIAFMASNLLFFAYLCCTAFQAGLGFSDLWWFVLIFAALIGTVTTLYLKKKLDFGKVGPLMLVYLSTVTLHGSFSVALACNTGDTRLLMLCGGLILFMVSDYFLTVNKFVSEKNWILRCNSGTYFMGLLIAALSLSF